MSTKNKTQPLEDPLFAERLLRPHTQPLSSPQEYTAGTQQSLDDMGACLMVVDEAIGGTVRDVWSRGPANPEVGADIGGFPSWNPRDDIWGRATRVADPASGGRTAPYVGVTINGAQQVRVNLAGMSPEPAHGNDTAREECEVTEAMRPFSSRSHFDVHIVSIIPFDLSEDPLLSHSVFDLRAEFISANGERRTHFLCTLEGGLVPGNVFSEKLLLDPVKIGIELKVRNWRPEGRHGTEHGVSQISPPSSAHSTGPLPPQPSSTLDDDSPSPETEKLKSTILKLLELKCVTGSGPIKATRLRSDIKETSSNELIIAGLRDVKWTEFLKKLNDEGLLHMTPKGQENWVSLHEHDKDSCSNLIVEKKNIAQCMEHLLGKNSNLPISDLMDMLFEHPVASPDLWRMMSPNWKTLRRVLLREDAQRKGIRLDPAGDGCVLVSL